MLNTILVLCKIALTISVYMLARHLLKGKTSDVGQVAAAIVCLCAALISLSAADAAAPKRIVTVMALQEKNEAAASCELTIDRIKVNGRELEEFTPSSGKWCLYKGQYRWFEPGDKRLTSEITESVSFTFSAADEVEIVFWGNKWKGKAAVEADGERRVVDTYRAADGDVSCMASAPLGRAVQAAAVEAAVFTAYMLALCGGAFLLVLLARHVVGGTTGTRSSVQLQKMLKYRFLFEELVKRDFKKKYKRTVLGMAWSILSPLLTLFVMKLVFTQFFGRTMEHYTTYLFCGNLIFAYFNESTSQGMTSLVGNAGIFTKINVSKYLFLFSKNVQTLLNFGLTLCVFFVFCVIDRIDFTWRFVCLLYPVVMLMLFNIGVGLILSALFVFFKDIQYLWSVFTMLLMYMSAIFYTIDGYSPMVRNLFLLNPVYLFIRYFRKIVIEATIPTVWFHLLMLADVGIVLGLGCWMYKKYNTKFLYYV